MYALQLTIPGKPIAKKRPRFFRRGQHVGTYSDQVTEEGRWILRAREQIRGKEPIKGQPIEVSMEFFMPIPKSMSKKLRQQAQEGVLFHTKKPDLDNLEKWVLDCLNGIAWGDDSSVVWIRSRKIYADNPRTAVIIRTL